MYIILYHSNFSKQCAMENVFLVVLDWPCEHIQY